MKILIDIPDEIYKKYMDDWTHSTDVLHAVRNGTPLPKGHGDLIDRDSLELDCDWSDYYDGYSAYSESQVRLTPTIIEADKERESE